MSMAAEPVYRYHRLGFTFEVWPGRIEIAERGAFGTKRRTIPIRAIDAVEAAGVTGKLRIIAGKDRYEFTIGRDRDQARDAILSQM